MTIARSEPPASPTTTLDSVATGLQADAYDGLSADEARRRLEDGRTSFQLRPARRGGSGSFANCESRCRCS